MSKVQSFYHIIINTKGRKMTITNAEKTKLYYYMLGITRNLGCKLIRINGIPNHIHLLVDLSPTISLSKYMQELKRASSIWLKQTPEFPNFEGWGKEYCALSKSECNVQKVKEYIINQEEHHKLYDYETELRQLMEEVGLPWQPEYLD
jgi:REP element-mobilizing transposase RayT